MKNYYVTWDSTGEHFWTATPYRDVNTRIWSTEGDSPENKISVPEGTLEQLSWEIANLPSLNCYKLEDNNKCRHYINSMLRGVDRAKAWDKH